MRGEGPWLPTTEERTRMGGGRRARVASFARMRSCSVGWGIFALIHAIGHWYINISLRGSGPLRSTAVDVGRRRGRRAALGPKPVRAQVSPASRASRARRSQSYSKSGWVTSSIESARLLNNHEITWAMGPSVAVYGGSAIGCPSMTIPIPIISFSQMKWGWAFIYLVSNSVGVWVSINIEGVTTI